MQAKSKIYYLPTVIEGANVAANAPKKEIGQATIEMEIL